MLLRKKKWDQVQVQKLVNKTLEVALDNTITHDEPEPDKEAELQDLHIDKMSQMSHSVLKKFMHKKRPMIWKESDVPLDILFNNEINRIKDDEREVMPL